MVAVGCVPRYNAVSPVLSEPELQAADRFPYGGANVTLQSINDRYSSTEARCTKVQGAMQREVDGIETKNLAIGASFAAVAAGLAAASGIYSLSKGDDADPTVSALLALGAGASTTPTFFYLGSDQRATTVKERLTKVEERRKSSNDAWRAVKNAQTNITIANAELRATKEEYVAARCDAAAAPECPSLLDAVKRASGAARDAQVRGMEAIDALDDAVRDLRMACQ